MVFILYFGVTLLKVWRHPDPYPHESPSHSVSFLHCLQPDLPNSFKTHTDLLPLEVCFFFFFFPIISSRRWGLEFWILIVQKMWVLSKSHSSLSSRRQGLICYQMFVMMNTNSLPACILPFTWSEVTMSPHALGSFTKIHFLLFHGMLKESTTLDTGKKMMHYLKISWQHNKTYWKLVCFSLWPWVSNSK